MLVTNFLQLYSTPSTVAVPYSWVADDHSFALYPPKFVDAIKKNKWRNWSREDFLTVTTSERADWVEVMVAFYPCPIIGM